MVTRATLNVSGLSEYLERIAKAGLDIDAATQRGLMKGGEVFRSEMESLAPVGESGDLKAAIILDGPFQDGNINYVEVGVINADEEVSIYGNVQEYGSPSKNIPAQPYIRPAIDAKRTAVMREIRESLKAEGLAD